MTSSTLLATSGSAPKARRAGNVWSWQGELGQARFCFAGRSLGARRERTPERLLVALHQPSLQAAWVRQVHSVKLVQATPGDGGEADALWTEAADLALTIRTADCVPVLLADGPRLVAIHAGWRGISAGIISRASGELGTGSRAVAAIGPAIGPCCYEVDDDVAAEIEAAVPADDSILRPMGRKPHVDLQLAVRHQLEAAGIRVAAEIKVCTRCNPERLCSYRRDGSAAGRNLAFIWR